ncbi:MAG: hypothetical protein HKN08_03945 [Gammaproteobacteria bacterium]|nr:hypothetical protein [Gammaproteobacteria bacterium]
MVLRLTTLLLLVSVSNISQANEFRGLAVNDILGPNLITQCEVPVGFSSYAQQASLDSISDTYVPFSGGSEYLKLMKSSRGYRLYQGNDLVARHKYLENSGDDDFSIHLLIDRGKGPEHLVFLIDLEGKGEMVWANDSNTSFTSCTI